MLDFLFGCFIGLVIVRTIGRFINNVIKIYEAKEDKPTFIASIIALILSLTIDILVTIIVFLYITIHYIK